MRVGFNMNKVTINKILISFILLTVSILGILYTNGHIFKTAAYVEPYNPLAENKYTLVSSGEDDIGYYETGYRETYREYPLYIYIDKSKEMIMEFEIQSTLNYVSVGINGRKYTNSVTYSGIRVELNTQIKTMELNFRNANDGLYEIEVNTNEGSIRYIVLVGVPAPKIIIESDCTSNPGSIYIGIENNDYFLFSNLTFELGGLLERSNINDQVGFNSIWIGNSNNLDFSILQRGGFGYESLFGRGGEIGAWYTVNINGQEFYSKMTHQPILLYLQPKLISSNSTSIYDSFANPVMFTFSEEYDIHGAFDYIKNTSWFIQNFWSIERENETFTLYKNTGSQGYLDSSAVKIIETNSLDNINALLEELENGYYLITYDYERTCDNAYGNDAVFFTVYKPNAKLNIDRIINPTSIYGSDFNYGYLDLSGAYYSSNIKFTFTLYNENDDIIYKYNKSYDSTQVDDDTKVDLSFDLSSLEIGSYRVVMTEELEESYFNQAIEKTSETTFIVRYPNTSIDIDRYVNPSSIVGNKKLGENESTLKWELYDDNDNLLFSDTTNNVSFTILENLIEQDYKIIFIETDNITGEEHRSIEEFTIAYPEVSILIDNEVNPTHIEGVKKLNNSLSSIVWKLETVDGDLLFTGNNTGISETVLSVLPNGTYVVTYREEIIGYSEFYSEASKEFKIVKVTKEENITENPKTGARIPWQLILNIIFASMFVVGIFNIFFTFRRIQFSPMHAFKEKWYGKRL